MRSINNNSIGWLGVVAAFLLVVIIMIISIPFGVNFETGVDYGVLISCGSSDYGDFEGQYPVVWVKTDNGHYSYYFIYEPMINDVLDEGEFYFFEYGYEYMPSGCCAGEGTWVKSLSRIRDSNNHIVWGDW